MVPRIYEIFINKLLFVFLWLISFNTEVCCNQESTKAEEKLISLHPLSLKAMWFVGYFLSVGLGDKIVDFYLKEHIL